TCHRSASRTSRAPPSSSSSTSSLSTLGSWPRRSQRPGRRQYRGVQTLAKGANAPLPPGPVAVRVSAAAPVDISALLVTAEGTVRGDADFVFYNQPTAPGVRHEPAGVDVEPRAVDPAIERVVVAASLDGRGPATFGALGDLRMDVAVAGEPFA